MAVTEEGGRAFPERTISERTILGVSGFFRIRYILVPTVINSETVQECNFVSLQLRGLHGIERERGGRAQKAHYAPPRTQLQSEYRVQV